MNEIRIIKLGQIPEDKVYQGKCHKCKTEVEFTLKTIGVTKETSHMDGTYAIWNCPLCLTRIFTNI